LTEQTHQREAQHPDTVAGRPSTNQAANSGEEYHESEGHSIAGWVGVALMIIGSISIAVGLFIEVDLAVWIGLGVFVLGVIAWPALKLAGLGPKNP